MTDTVLVQTTSSEAIVLVSSSGNLVTEAPVTTVVTSLGQQGPQGIQGPAGAPGPTGPTGPSAAISTASDVDISTLINGSLLVYNQGTSKWTSTDTLAAQIVDSGQY